MATKIRKLMAMLVLLCVAFTAIPMQALAAGEGTTSLAGDVIDVVISIPESENKATVTVEGSNDKELSVEVNVDSNVSNEGGSTNIKSELSAENQKVQGEKVNYDSKCDITIDADGVMTGTVEGSYQITPSNGKTTINGEFSAEYGVDADGLQGTKVDVPLTEGGSDTEKGAEAGTVLENTTETIKNGEVTTTVTVTEQGSVTVDTTDITITENVSDKTDMEYVKTETNPTDSNDLSHVGQAPDEFLPGYEGDAVIPELPDVNGDGEPDYDYVYVGSSNSSKFFPAIVFENAMTNEEKLAMYGENAYIKKNSITWYYVKWLNETSKSKIAYDENGDYVTDENGYILDVDGNRIFKEERTEVRPDGTTSYLHRFDNYGTGLKVEGWYENGEWVKELNGKDGYYGIWAGPQQFVLVDGEGNIITAYCADFTTPTQDSFGYNMENLEDATYYSEEEAKMIRSIAANGYWGTESGIGSLEAMKAILLASGKFSEEELASLNDGVALTATQMAIWSCSNKMSGLEFVNAHYSEWGTGDVPADKEDEVKVLFKLYDYLMKLAPAETKGTTADTIINADNFIEDMNVTVVEKVEDHENNKDKNKDNDAYAVDLTFALVVTPSTENGDDLVVSVVSDGKVIAKGRIAGDLQDGEVQLTAVDGNYTFTDIILTEGAQTFNLKLEGVQNLEAGVYLYSSQVVEETSSQTLVGLAGGERGVDVSMEITFDFNVVDQVTATERVQRTQKTNPTPGRRTPPPEEITTIEEPPVPLSGDGLIEILDDEIPLADAPETGDNSIIYLMMSLISVLGLCAIILSKKQCKG